jgi:hypothetical protein
MDGRSSRSRHQFSLSTLLLLAIAGPPLIAGCAYLLRSLEISAPPFAVVLSVAEAAFWVIVLSYVVRRALFR